jgi:two-component system phosphate regulon sensor histidine kinase PhoR
MKLHYKLFITFGLIIAVTLGVVFVYLDNSLNKKNIIQLKDNIKKQSAACRVILSRSDIKTNNLKKLAQDIGSSLGLRVTFISNSGVVLADSDVSDKYLSTLENHSERPEIKATKNTGEGWSQRFSTTLKKDIIYYATPLKTVRFDGVIRFAIPVEKVSIMSKKIDDVIAFSLFVAFIASLILAIIAFNIISLPIRRIAKKANEIANSDFSNKILINKKDEVGELARSLNMMGDHLRARINDILSNNSKFEAVLLSMSDGVVVLDSNGFIQLMNRTLKNMLNIDVNPVGKKPIEVIRNVNIQNISESILKQADSVITQEEHFLFPSNKTIILHAAPVIVDHKIIGAVIVFSDITELRKLETVRKDFVANVSHELRTPISNIKGYAETLLDEALEDKQNALDFIKIIHNESGRLASLIDDILDLSKIETDAFKLNLVQNNLFEIAKDAIASLDRDAKDKGIMINNELALDEKILADKSLLTQVFVNLIHNAIKYSHNDSIIILSSKMQDELIKIEVKDQGLGIPEKDLSRIFERFYRVDKARSKSLKGTGLGLAIVKHIVQTHGGDVYVKSVEGYGSTFGFTLPVK